MTEWKETLQQFLRISAQRGVYRTAQDVPTGKDTIYRLMRGQTEIPTKAVQAAITRLVERHKQEQNDGIHPHD